MGFTFDDTDKKGVATPLAEMRHLLEKDPRNAACIFPYIGGEEINTNPAHAHHRYVINFGEMSHVEARRWPDSPECGVPSSWAGAVPGESPMGV